MNSKEEKEAIKEMLRTEGWKVYIKELEKRRARAMYNVLISGNKLWRGRLLEIDDVIGIPVWMLKEEEEES